MSVFIQAGNTVRFTCKFYDPSGNLTTPTSIKLTLYDYQYNKLSEFPLTDANRIEMGLYFFDYTTPNEEKKYIYEWYGMVNGFPSIKRETFTTFFL